MTSSERLSRILSNGSFFVFTALLAALGLATGIVATQFSTRQSPREPCELSHEHYVYWAVSLSVVLPWLYVSSLNTGRARQRLLIIAALATSAALFFLFDWRGLLYASWRESW